ncbi:MAG: hypothetical protein ACK5MJ_06720 [Alphaproteobacteria bacterium]
MTENLDLESWEKSQGKKQKSNDFHQHTKNVSKEKFDIRKIDGNLEVEQNSRYKKQQKHTLPQYCMDAMMDDEIVDVLVSAKRHETSLWVIKIFVSLFCLFFIGISFFIILSEGQPLGIIFTFVPLIMLRQIFKAKKTRYMVFGRKSFYYAPLMKRAINYDEIQGISYIQAHIQASSSAQRNRQKMPHTTFYSCRLLQFVFYRDILEDDLGSEATMIHYNASYNFDVSREMQACIFPQPFDAQELNAKIAQYFQINLK